LRSALDAVCGLEKLFMETLEKRAERSNAKDDFVALRRPLRRISTIFW
jgi:hypothetical protein